MNSVPPIIILVYCIRPTPLGASAAPRPHSKAPDVEGRALNRVGWRLWRLAPFELIAFFDPAWSATFCEIHGLDAPSRQHLECECGSDQARLSSYRRFDSERFWPGLSFPSVRGRALLPAHRVRYCLPAPPFPLSYYRILPILRHASCARSQHEDLPTSRASLRTHTPMSLSPCNRMQAH